MLLPSIIQFYGYTLHITKCCRQLFPIYEASDTQINNPFPKTNKKYTHIAGSQPLEESTVFNHSKRMCACQFFHHLPFLNQHYLTNYVGFRVNLEQGSSINPSRYVVKCSDKWNWQRSGMEFTFKWNRQHSLHNKYIAYHSRTINITRLISA